MSPKKRTKNVNWPKYVTEANGRIVYRPRVPQELRGKIKTDKGGFCTPIKLGVVGDPDDKIIRAYVAAKQQFEIEKEPDKNTLNWLRAEFEKSTAFTDLAPKTQTQYSQFLTALLSHPIKSAGKEKTLGSLLVSQITSPLLRRVADKRLKNMKEEGKKGTVYINRQLAALSSAFSWGLQYIDGLGITANPCVGIKRFKEAPKKRYVTDKEYAKQYEIAGTVADYLPVLFEHAYLLASRGIEVRALKISDVTEEGYEVNRRKGSESNTIQWSDRLRAAYEAALTLHRKRKVSSVYLITSTKGGKLSERALQSAMQRLKKKMAENGLDGFWTLHDLKRKGITDSENKGIGGHKTEEMRRRYDLERKKFSPPK